MAPCLRRWCLGFERCNFPRVPFRRPFQALNFSAVQKSIVKLQDFEPFSQGGNRLCFVHPDRADVCVKVDQVDKTPELKRRRKGWIAFLRPLRHYDENYQESHALRQLHRHYPAITQHLPLSYGLVSTDQGVAHSMQLIRDDDGLISATIERYLWEHGNDLLSAQAIDEFKRNWLQASPPSRDLLPHNLLIQKLGSGARLVLVDGYGRPSRLRFPRWIMRRRTIGKLRKLDRRIADVLQKKRMGEVPKRRVGILKRDL